MAADVGRGLHRDRISDLPDAILVSILSLLRLDEAARCTVLASRWRHSFPLTILDFNVFFPLRRRSVVNLVSSIRTSYTSINGDEDPDGRWLQELARHGVQEIISDDALHALLAHCTALERLRMQNMRACGSVHILSYDGRFDELFIEDAPNLEWVLWDNKSMYRGNAYLVVAQAPKLEFLGYLGTENQILVNTLMASLKTLAVDVKNRGAGYINWFMKLLELFPCLETLYIRSEISPVNHSDAPESWNLLRSIPCVDNSLETVVFEVYRGHKWQREMARFLHMRSRCLKTMEFHCMDDSSFAIYRGPPKEEWVRKQKELLCIDSRASRDMPIFSSSSIRFRLIITICAATNIQKRRRRRLRPRASPSPLPTSPPPSAAAPASLRRRARFPFPARSPTPPRLPPARRRRFPARSPPRRARLPPRASPSPLPTSPPPSAAAPASLRPLTDAAPSPSTAAPRPPPYTSLAVAAPHRVRLPPPPRPSLASASPTRCPSHSSSPRPASAPGAAAAAALSGAPASPPRRRHH
ncbi:hypothetical protein EJB05_17098, partial [Eragrostis curvula]